MPLAGIAVGTGGAAGHSARVTSAHDDLMAELDLAAKVRLLTGASFFELTGDELARIDALDTGVRSGPDPDSITLENFHRDIPEA